HLVPVTCQRGPQCPPDRRLVVDHQHPLPAHDFPSPLLSDSSTGNVKRNVVPSPTRLSTEIRPPCASTNPFAIANPIPVPGTRPVFSARKNLSKRWGTSLGGMPGPVSRTASSIAPRTCRAASVTTVPGGVYLRAFSPRFISTCAIST